MIHDPIKILLVEDDASIRTLYQFKLETLGYSVRLAEDGQAGLAVAEAFQPDLILLDLRMPVMSGDRMLARLRETGWGAGMRVIILTNISRSEAPASLGLLNVDRYVVKAHHTPAQLADIIGELIGRPS